jgi:hypothetical protein
MLNVENVRLTPEDKKRYTLCMPQDELAELSPTERLKYERAQVENVFGEGVTFRNGVPQECGLGSPGNLNANHLAALAREKSGRDLNEAILSAAKRA